MTTEAQTRLEDLVNKHGLSAIVGMLADVAFAKEERMRNSSLAASSLAARKFNQAGVRIIHIQQDLLELGL